MSIHVHPLNDERPHDLNYRGECWCEPTVEWIDPATGLGHTNHPPIVIHNAADCRELTEGDGQSAAPGKGWGQAVIDPPE